MPERPLPPDLCDDMAVILAALIEERNAGAWFVRRWREEHDTDRPNVGPIFS